MQSTASGIAHPFRVHLTVDVEVWPARRGNWPHEPLADTVDCRRELEAYIFGNCAEGSYGLSYQLKMLNMHGLRATFFVDPMFSFALGLESLRDIVNLIQTAGQRVELHLHPEWLTDRRCVGLPDFQGPMIGDYPEETQQTLLQVGLARLAEAGAKQVTAFRAGSWGARASTLRAVSAVGLALDASLNAHYAHSLDDLPCRLELQGPSRVGEVVELPVTRFDDGRTARGRPLSLVGVSVAEMRCVLQSLQRIAAPCAIIVLHSNEFVRTENLWKDCDPVPRRWIIRRFAKLCSFLKANSAHLPTNFVVDHAPPVTGQTAARELVRTGFGRTAGRLAGQLVSRWY